MSATKWMYFLVTVILIAQKKYATGFLLAPDELDCGNETYLTKEKCTWMSKYERNLGKYRNFFANLLEEENQIFAVEIQELYNIVSSALVETNLNKKQRMFYYSIWLIEKTEDLEDFLISKGLKNIVKNSNSL